MAWTDEDDQGLAEAAQLCSERVDYPWAKEACKKAADEIRRLQARVASLMETLEYACEEPPTGCECPGCSLARERLGGS